MKGIWKKKKDIWQVMKITTGKGQVEYYFVGFPKRRNYSRGSGDILHFPKIKVGSCQNHPTRPETGNKWKTYQNRPLPKNEFFGGKWREYGRNNGTYDRLGKSLQERARLNTILCDFPRGEIILGVLEIPCTPQKSKWAAASWIKTINTECFPFHTHSHRVFFGSIWRECERNVGKYEKMEICRKEPVMKMMVEHHFAGIPKFFFKIFFVQPFKI